MLRLDTQNLTFILIYGRELCLSLNYIHKKRTAFLQFFIQLPVLVDI